MTDAWSPLLVEGADARVLVMAGLPKSLAIPNGLQYKTTCVQLGGIVLGHDARPFKDRAIAAETTTHTETLGG